jgi:hypothetical protein
MREYDLIADWHWTDPSRTVGVAEAFPSLPRSPLTRAFSTSGAAMACRLPKRS